MLNTTSSAPKSLPSWNFTPWRSFSSQVRGSISFQETARDGTIWRFWSRPTTVSKICCEASCVAPVVEYCGSIDAGSVDAPTFRSDCAPEPAAANNIRHSAADRAARRFP